MNEAATLDILMAVDKYAASQVAKEHLNAEGAFLYGKLGQEFLGLQRNGTSPKEAVMLWNQPGNLWGFKHNPDFNRPCSRCNEVECICGDPAFEAWVTEELDAQCEERSNDAFQRRAESGYGQ